MADDVVDGAPQGAAEVPDLRSTILAAVEAQRNPEPEASGGAAAEAVVEAGADKVVPGKLETEAERNERLRDKGGKFATEKNAVKPDGAKLDVAAKPAAAAKVDGAEAAKPDVSADNVKPPPGFSPTAKVVWSNKALTEEEWSAVKQDIARRNDEVNAGFTKLAEFKTIEPFAEMARKSGTTLDKALQNYVGIESELARDFTGGIATICQGRGVHPIQLANQIIAKFGAPSQTGAGEIAEARQQAPVVDPATAQRIAALEARLQQQDHQGVQTEIQRFASDPKNVFFENIKADMGRLINTGQAQTLEDAYDQACWANKEIRALLIKQQAPVVPSADSAAAVQKAKAAAKATGGAPSAGLKANAGAEGGSIRDTIVAAVNAQRGL